MNIDNRITKIEKELDTLREKWKQGSPALRKMIEGQASAKKAEIQVLKRVQKKRAKEKKEETMQTTII